MSHPFLEFAYRQRGHIPLVNHRHVNGDGYEFILVLSGRGSALVFDRTYPLLDGTLLLIDAAYPHSLYPAKVDEYLRCKLIVDRSYLRGVLTAAGALDLLDDLVGPHGGKCVYLRGERLSQADQLFQDMQRAGPDSPENRLGVLTALLSLFSLYDQDGHGEAHAVYAHLPPEDEKLAPVLKYLRMRCAEPLSVEQIAEDNHISKYYLCRLFRRTTGMTMMQYLYEQRFSLARRQLADTLQPISTIALNCGFGSSSHFCTMFRRREGVTPNEYRAQAQKKN